MKHCIIVQWKDTVADKLALLPKIESVFQGVLELEKVHSVKLIPNVVERPNRYDLMIVIDMEKEALPAYDACSAHHEWKEQFGSLIASKAIFDAAEGM